MEDDPTPTSVNHELRILGMGGDDEEDLQDDVVEVFGNTTSPPVQDFGETPSQPEIDPAVEGTPGVGAGRGKRAPTPCSDFSDSISNKQKRSKVWDDFEEFYEQRNGSKVRVSARCNYCRKQLSAHSSGGTGHLLRHLKSCKPKMLRSMGMSQSLINFNADGSITQWEYRPKVARVELCRLIAREDLPICFGESAAFEEYIQRAHNPRFMSVSKQTVTRDFQKYYTERRAILVESLKNVSSVALTSDIWSGNAKEDYLSVVAHYVNSDWQLEKRILALKLIDVSHSARNIAERVLAVCEDYGISDKVFSITLDNASANTKAMDTLRPALSAYVGELFLHQRCACHIVNLIVKGGLDVFKPMLQAFRTAISFLNSSNQRIAAYKNFCVAKGIRPRKFGLDMDVRWNATYLMLKHLMPHRDPFSVFITANHPMVNGQPLLTDLHWTCAEIVLLFLEQFYDSTVVLSGVYYPTSPLVMHHILDIAGHLNNYENDMNLRNVVVPMKDKFLSYWADIPILYSFAFILDPRAKVRGFTNVLQIMSQLIGKDYSAYLTTVRAALSDTFAKYDTKFGAVRLERARIPGPSSGKRKTAWGKIFGADAAGAGGGSGASPGAGIGTGANPYAGFGAGSSSGAGLGACSSPLFMMTSASALLHAANSNANMNASELSAYLNSDTVSLYDDDFNILNWWHEHKHTYPVLSILARDVLTVPVSTISSESAFSLTGRIIEERRRRLGPDMVDILACIKDWEQADSKGQHTMDNLELQKAFENMYLDDDADNTASV